MTEPTEPIVGAIAVGGVPPDVKTVPPRMVRRRSRRLRAAGIVAWLGFTVLTIIVRLLEPEAWDLRITRAVQSVRPRPFRFVMWLISEPGFTPQTQVIPIAVTGLLSWLGWRREAAFVLVTFPAQWAAAVIKHLLQRARPAEPSVIVPRVLRDTSFPSGHTVHYVTFYGFLWYLAFARLDSSPLRRLILGITGALVLLVGPSRVYLGHHWASDVLGGYSLGFGVLVAMIDGYRRGEWPMSWRLATASARLMRRRIARLLNRGKRLSAAPAVPRRARSSVPARVS